ncbi:hypothetical protein Tco_1402316 [Tanacetum coccineum]
MGGSIAQTRSKRGPTLSYDALLLGGNTPGSDEERLEHQDDLTDFVPLTPHDSPLSGGYTLGSDEGRPNINELMVICTNLSNRVLALETSKTAQDLVIKKRQKIRKEAKGKNSRDETLQDCTADPSTSTAGDILEDEMMTIANTLVAIRSTRPRTTSVVIRDVKEEPRRETPIPTIQSQDKEDQAQFEREQRIARESAAEQEAKDVALIEQMEDIQARMDADELLAERLQQEEREQFTIEEKSRMLVEMIAERKRFFAA